MTTTETGAFEAVLAHHAVLEDGVTRRVAAVRVAVDIGGGYEPAAAELVAYAGGEVLAHAMAEEHSIYRAAAAKPELAETVAGLVDEHRRLATMLERLALASDGARAAAEAEAIGVLFTAHVAKENDLVLPPLAADPSVDIAGLLVEMHRRTEAAGDESQTVEERQAPDTDTSLLRLLLHAAGRLAQAGEGDEACRLAAEAWATLRVARPDLAGRVTAVLHRLVRSVTAEPVSFGPAARAAGSGADAVLDVRALAPAQRHAKIFTTYDALGPGTGFVLVNDHDPKPLRYQFEAEHPGEHSWDVLQAGPSVWRVRIGRPAATGDVADDGGRHAAGAEPDLDVRRFPHGQRHDVIFTTYDALATGSGFVLVNDHDPRPLRYQFEAQHPGRYSWDYLETGPAVWRVRIGRTAQAGG